MRYKNSLRLIIFLVGTISLAMIYYSRYSFKGGWRLDRILNPQGMMRRNASALEGTLRQGYAIWTSQCKMLDPNPWNESILKYLTDPQPLICSYLPLLTYVDQQDNLTNVLKINKKVINKYKKNAKEDIHCCYSVITRINQSKYNYNSTADSLYELTNCTYFKDQVLLSDETEFILVECQSHQNNKKPKKTVYKDVHPIVPVLPEVKLKIKKFTQKSKPESESRRLNVIILGVDSVSKPNFRRVMPATLKYLQQNNWVELNGYNKVGDNTFPNLMGILTGEPMQKLQEICLANHSQKMDACPSIWKEYNEKGYITLYAEDTPSISTFNLKRTGFVEKPTDYYMRPFMLAAHDLLTLKTLNGLPVCLGPVLIVDHILNYAKRFLRAFNQYSYFSLLWLNSLSHNGVNCPRALDVSLHRFLNELSTIGTYENSLVLLLSDHGARFGNIRETFLGYLEERLPFIFIWCPTWFREKYPDKYNDLLINQNRLTSPYDVYVTLKRLLDEENVEKWKTGEAISKACPRCKGLLEVQSLDRTCRDASIDVNWCMCSEFREIETTDDTASRIGFFVYKFIVSETKKLIKKENVKKSLCSEWKFLKIFKTLEILVPSGYQQYSLRNSRSNEIHRYHKQIIGSNVKIFVIIIELNPGKTKFESTVQMKTNSTDGEAEFAFLEPPKRLDSFYKTSKCIEDTLLKSYCYCVRKKAAPQ